MARSLKERLSKWISHFWLARWYANVMYALDRLFNALLLGDPDETMSSRLGKHLTRDEGGCRLCGIVCGFLSLVFFQRDHCRNNINSRRGYDTAHDRSVLSTERERHLTSLLVILGLLALYYNDAVLRWVGYLL